MRLFNHHAFKMMKTTKQSKGISKTLYFVAYLAIYAMHKKSNDEPFKQCLAILILSKPCHRIGIKLIICALSGII